MIKINCLSNFLYSQWNSHILFKTSLLQVDLCMTGVTLLGNHYCDGFVAADGNDESDDSDDDGNDVWFSDPSQMLLSVGGEAPATSLYCQHQFCRKEEVHQMSCTQEQ